MSVPPSWRDSANTGASRSIVRPLMLATARSKRSSPASSGRVPSRTSTTPCTPLAAAFSRAAFTACGSMSRASARLAPSLAAAMARMPEPAPRSSTAPPGRPPEADSSSARRHIAVVGCWPVPNAMPGSISMTVSPAATSWVAHEGLTRSRLPMRRGVAVHDVGFALETRRRLDGDAAGTTLAEGVGDGLGVDAGDLGGDLQPGSLRGVPRAPTLTPTCGHPSPACGRGARGEGHLVIPTIPPSGKTQPAPLLSQGVLYLAQY